MLTEQQLTSVLATERRIYAALSEVLELTGELSASIQRGDSVSVQLFLQLRQEPINQLREYQTNLAQQCRILPAEDRKELEGLLSGQAPAASPAAPSRSSFSATAPSGPGLSRPTGPPAAACAERIPFTIPSPDRFLLVHGDPPQRSARAAAG